MNRYVLDGHSTACTFDYTSQRLSDKIFIFILSMFFGGFCIPLLLIIVFYTKIWFILKKNENSFDIRVSYSRNVKTTVILPNENNIMKVYKETTMANLNNQNTKELLSIPKKGFILPTRRENKVLKITIISLFMFCFAWCPYAILSMYCQYGWNTEKYVNRYTSLLAALFAKTSVVNNPIIYITLNSDCQYYIKNILGKITSK